MYGWILTETAYRTHLKMASKMSFCPLEKPTDLSCMTLMGKLSGRLRPTARVVTVSTTCQQVSIEYRLWILTVTAEHSSTQSRKPQWIHPMVQHFPSISQRMVNVIPLWILVSTSLQVMKALRLVIMSGKTETEMVFKNLEILESKAQSCRLPTMTVFLSQTSLVV